MGSIIQLPFPLTIQAADGHPKSKMPLAVFLMQEQCFPLGLSPQAGLLCGRFDVHMKSCRWRNKPETAWGGSQLVDFTFWLQKEKKIIAMPGVCVDFFFNFFN